MQIHLSLAKISFIQEKILKYGMSHEKNAPEKK